MTVVPGSPTWVIAPHDVLEMSEPPIDWMKVRFWKMLVSSEMSVGRQLASVPEAVAPASTSPPPKSTKSGPPESP
ncbi:MAG TPA: hypothetical protein VLI07_16490 [Candidatus Binatus sp.]|nr:hypothetical protein [Candidatus Binatus sp.]